MNESEIKFLEFLGLEGCYFESSASYGYKLVFPIEAKNLSDANVNGALNHISDCIRNSSYIKQLEKQHRDDIEEVTKRADALEQYKIFYDLYRGLK